MSAAQYDAKLTRSSYLEQLAAENERLREQVSQSQSPGFITADDHITPRGWSPVCLVLV